MEQPPDVPAPNSDTPSGGDARPELPLDDALTQALREVESGSDELQREGVAALRGLVARAVAERGGGSDSYLAAMRGLARGLVELGEDGEARELYGVVAEVSERRYEAHDREPNGESSELPVDELHARLMELSQVFEDRARAIVTGVDGGEVPAAIQALDAVISRSEQEIGLSFGGTLWLLARRAELLMRLRVDDGLAAYDLLIARAAADGEGAANHLRAIGEKAGALSRLDSDEASAKLWERVLAGRRALLGLDHPETLEAWSWWARTLWWAGNSEQAEQEFELLLPELTRVLGEDSPAVLSLSRFWVGALQRLGRDLNDTARLERALELVRRIAVLETARYGPENRQVLVSRVKAVDLVDDLGRYAEARVELLALTADAAELLGADDSLLVSIGETRQWVLVHLRDELRRERGGELRTETQLGTNEDAALTEIEAEGRQAADALCELVLARGLRAAEQGGDVAEALRALDWVVKHPANWRDFGSQERIDVLTRWADRFAEVATGPLAGQLTVLRAESQLRERLGHAYFNAETPTRALGEQERVLELERLHYEQELADELERKLAGQAVGARLGPIRIARAVDSLAITMRRLGRAAAAEQLLSDTILDAEQAEPRAQLPDDILVELRNSRALTRQDLGRYDEAVAEARALWETSGDPRRALDLSFIYVNADRPAEAEALLLPVLAKLEALGEGRGPTAQRMRGNLARAACDQGRHEAAAVAWEELFQLERVTLGESHRDTLITLHNLALEQRHLHHTAEAVRCAEEVVRLRTAYLGERSPDTLRSMSVLVGALADADRLPEARAMSEHLLRVTFEVLGAAHPDTLRRVREYESLRERAGAGSGSGSGEEDRARGGEASELVAAIEREVSESLTRDARSDPNTRLRNAEHLEAQGRLGEALLEYAKVRDALSGVGGLTLLAAERGIADCYSRLESYLEAVDAYARVIPQLEALLPGDRWALADAYNSQALAFSRLKRVDEMVEARRKAIALADSAGSNPDRAIWLRIWLGRGLRTHGRLKDGLALHREALAEAEARAGVEIVTKLEAADDLAEALAGVGRHREALRIYRANIPRMEREYGSESPAVSRAKARQKASAQQAAGPLRVAVGMVFVLGVLALALWDQFKGIVENGYGYTIVIAVVGGLVTGLAAVWVIRAAQRARRRKTGGG